jgi:hypothetical protein
VFDEISFETPCSEIYEREQPVGLVVSMGGQVPNNLAPSACSGGVRILGTSAESIDARGPQKFSACSTARRRPAALGPRDRRPTRPPGREQLGGFPSGAAELRAVAARR